MSGLTLRRPGSARACLVSAEGMVTSSMSAYPAGFAGVSGPGAAAPLPPERLEARRPRRAVTAGRPGRRSGREWL